MQIFKAVKHIFGHKKWFGIFLALGLFMFVLMFYIPILSIPGNDMKFQLELFSAKDYAFLAVLSALSAMIVTMNLNIFTNRVTKKVVSGTLMGSVGVLSGIVSSVFATATCGMCVLSLFSFLGAGAVFTLVDNQNYILLGTSVFLTASLHFSSKKLNDNCAICK